MAEFHTSSVIRAQITTIDYKIGLTSDVDSLCIRSRLINISAGTFEVILTRSTPNLGEKINEVIIEPEDTTIRAKLTIQEDKFTRLINSLHSEKRLNAVVEALIDATLTLSDQGDLIIDHSINTKITNFDFKRNFT
ncbi:MAG: hypothetical protein VW235_06310 [Rhodospirillaceae bacterium]